MEKTQGAKKTQYISKKNSRKIQKTQLPATQVVAICLKIAEKKACNSNVLLHIYLRGEMEEIYFAI